MKLQTSDVKDRIECEHLIKTAVTGDWNRPISYNVTNNLICGSQPPIKIDTQNIQRTFEMLCVDEAGIYQALSRSTRLEARKFIDWISHSLVDLRKAVGLEGYEALKLTDASVQKLISDKIDISYVEPTGDIIPVKAEPMVIQNITNVNVDYRKVAVYSALGVAGVVIIYAGVRYIVRKVKAKKVNNKED